MAGCAGHRAHEAEPDMPLPPGVSEAPKGLKFSVKITPTKFKLGQRVTLEATLFNDSAGKFEQHFPSSCMWDYEIASGGRVIGPGRTCDPAPADLALEPGELRMIMRDWTGNDHYFDAHEKLLPGIYQVTAGLIDEHQQIIPMADPVTIEVVQ
jgi:hypothetical protein